MKSPALFNADEYKYWVTKHTNSEVVFPEYYPVIVITNKFGYIEDQVCIRDFNSYASISILRKRDFDDERQFDLVVNDESKDPDEILGCAFFPDSFEEGQVYKYRALACHLCIRPYDTGTIEQRINRKKL